MPPWLINLLGGGIIQTIASFIPNPAEAAKAAAELQGKIVNAFLAADGEQREINRVEAASASMFVAGWRPAVGWLCVAVLAWQWFFAPMMTWWLVVFAVTTPPLPVLASQDVQQLLYALLGIGGLRTLDKIGGVDTRSVGGIVNAVKKVIGR